MPSPNRKLRVFLCHAKEDKLIVHELYKQLNAEGWMDVWLDEVKLLPGQNWDMEIEKAVEAADAVIVCLSNNSVTKEGYVQAEMSFILDIARTKPEETIFVIPLRLDDCIVPRRLRLYQYVDYFPKSHRKTSYQRLLESLKLRVEKLGILIGKAPLEKSPTIIIGDDNASTQNAPAQKPERAKETQKVDGPPEKIPAPKFNFRWLSIGGVVVIVLIFLVYGFTHFPKPPKPSPTAQATFASKLSTATSVVPKPTLGIVSSMISPKDGMTLVYVPAGKFLMGSTDSDTNANPDEKPQHTVYLDSFWIDQTDVTNAMYAKCVFVGSCTATD